MTKKERVIGEWSVKNAAKVWKINLRYEKLI